MRNKLTISNFNMSFDSSVILKIYFSRVDQTLPPDIDPQYAVFFEMELSQLRELILQKFRHDPVILKILDFSAPAVF